MEKRVSKTYTKGELEFVYFKAKVLMIISFLAGMMMTAAIYGILAVLIK